MLMLYMLLLVMVAAGVGILVVPFVRARNYKNLSIVIVSFCFVALGLYQVSSDKIALSDWMNHGRQRYALLQQFADLGGVEGAIIQIEKHLQDNPQDKQGWMILGKLYLSRHDDAKAQAAFRKARDL
jgi:cytochrome c-type biogenesis protein CcmH/NrfG